MPGGGSKSCCATTTIPAKGYLSRALPFREGETEGDYDHLARVLEWSAGSDDESRKAKNEAAAGHPARDDRARRRPSDPRNSVWVSANAGSGKTHVLSRRVIRLLLHGTEPSKILCLTYTRAAAANMAKRVYDDLAEWTALDDAELAETDRGSKAQPPDAGKLARARRLFAEALETPGGLKIQTIHAFCEAMLHQFPLEANIAGHFEMLDQQMEQALIAEARRAMITGAAAAGQPRAGGGLRRHPRARRREAGSTACSARSSRSATGCGISSTNDTPGRTCSRTLFEEFGFETDETAESDRGVGLAVTAASTEPVSRSSCCRAERPGKTIVAGHSCRLREACRASDP